jgi:hypothetical protein
VYTTGFLLWATAVVFGLVQLWRYENAPGIAASAPATWPDNDSIPRPRHRPTLVVLIHPQCSCSRATLSELERLQARLQREVDTYVLMLSPATKRDWTRSPLWQRAAAIQGITVVADGDGRQAARFGGYTSGQALLYDTAGMLVFSGGITASRGHEGDNAGRTAIEQLVAHASADRSSTFVFGCALFGPAASDDSEAMR